MTDCSGVAVAQLDRVARRNNLVEAYTFLVSPIARTIWRALPPSFPIDDLEQLGFLGLIEAAGSFESYARQKIRGAILDAVRVEWPEGTRKPLPEGHLEIPDSNPTMERLLVELDRLRELNLPDVRVLRRLKRRVAA